jgi:hypothetical protein
MLAVGVDDHAIQNEVHELMAQPRRLLAPPGAEVGQERAHGRHLGGGEHPSGPTSVRVRQFLQALHAAVDLFEDDGHVLRGPGEGEVLLEGVDLLLQAASFTLAARFCQLSRH